MLGRFFGIELFVHWSFGLLVAYVAYSTYSLGGTPSMIAFAIAQLFTIFLCVTLHEYGHSLAARRYGIETVDITLLPIGGVARLRRIPRVPIQELVIAVAGPAVNVVIATLLITGLAVVLGFRPLLQLTLQMMGFASDQGDLGLSDSLNQMVADSSLISLAILLVAINVWLVLFNMVPAFPMDGGRVLRSILAMSLPYGSATRWAQRVGVFCALIMAAIAVQSDPKQWTMLIIAAFIVYAGQMEARQVEMSDQFNGLSVADVMSHRPPHVSIDWTAAQLQQWWKDQSGSTAAVVGLGNVVAGVLTVGDVARHLARAAESGDEIRRTTAGALADYDFPLVEPSTPLDSIMGMLQKYHQLPVVDSHHKLIGWVDFDTLFARASLSRIRVDETRPTGDFYG
jgi:Zn-dependent protease/predicted transcriptional regulator